MSKFQVGLIITNSILILLLLFIIIIQTRPYEQYMRLVYKPESNCYNLSLQKTVACEMEYTSRFYKYNDTNDYIISTSKRLHTKGGDCKNWSEFFADELNSYGFNAYSVGFKTGKLNRHKIAIVSDSTGYCVIDQYLYECYGLI